MSQEAKQAASLEIEDLGLASFPSPLHHHHNHHQQIIPSRFPSNYFTLSRDLQNESTDIDHQASSSLALDSPDHLFDRAHHADHSLPSRSASRRASSPKTRFIGMANIVSPRLGAYQMWTPNYLPKDEVQERLQISETRKRAARIRNLWLSVFSCFVVFGICLLIFWLVFEPHSVPFLVQDISFQAFSVGQGQDSGGVPVQTLTMQCTISISLSNPSQFFGVHVAGGDIDLIYSQLIIGAGQIGGIDLNKSSQANVSTVVSAQDLPLYAVGSSLSDIYNAQGVVNLQIDVYIRSSAHVLWRPKFTSTAGCNINLNASICQVMRKECSYPM